MMIHIFDSIGNVWCYYQVLVSAHLPFWSHKHCKVEDFSNFVVVVQPLSCVWLPPPHELTIAHQASLTFTISQSLLTFMCIELVMLSNHLILCHPLLLLPSISLSIRVFSNKLALCIRWPKYWSFSFSPFNEYSGLISFGIHWFDFLTVQGTL